MRIYEGSPRQAWEEVLRSIGAFADEQQLKELLLLELETGFVLQGLGLQAGGAGSDSLGTVTKRTYQLSDDQIAQLMDAAAAKRGSADTNRPRAEITNYYEQALRMIGRYIDGQKAHDVFLFDQEGSFVVRLFGAGGSSAGHGLAEFTHDEIVAMIDAAPEQRNQSAPGATGAP